MTSEDSTLLTARTLTKYYPLRGAFNPFSRTKRNFIRAVDGVSIEVPRGKTVAIVGESGCGKTTLARALSLLSPPTNGEILFDGMKITKKHTDIRKLYREMQMVFQDPDSSLDPRFTIKETIAEPLHGLGGEGLDSAAIERRVLESMEAVGLTPELADRRPRHISGGQKQRVAIARAIVQRPKLVILDEPTSALDASVQAQILALLIKLQKEYNLTYLLITHNMAVAQYLSDLIAVMYAGKVVEFGDTKSIISKPRHPYTIALIASAPIPNPWKRNLLKVEIRGEVPSAINPPSGCKFHPRCPCAEEICSRIEPDLKEISAGHQVACHFVAKTA